MKNRSILLSITLHLLVSLLVYNLQSSVPIFKVPLNLHQKQSHLNSAQKKITIIRIEKPKPEKKMQIVNSQEIEQKKDLEKKPEFLGRINNQVEKQTRAKIVGSFQIQQNKNDEIKKPKTNQPSTQKTDQKPLKLSDFALKLDRNIRPSKPVNNEPNGGNSGEKFDKSQVAQSNDYIDDIPVGDITALNTQEFKFFGFYDRIRKSLETHWGVSLRDKAKKLFSKGKTLANNENYITSLQIKIDATGNIISVNIVGGSGLEELDHAAVESFNKAGPFPNPPKEMVSSGHAILEWGFVVKT